MHLRLGGRGSFAAKVPKLKESLRDLLYYLFNLIVFLCRVHVIKLSAPIAPPAPKGANHYYPDAGQLVYATWSKELPCRTEGRWQQGMRENEGFFIVMPSRLPLVAIGCN